MKRATLSHSAVTVFLAVSSVAFGQSNVKPQARQNAKKPACTFSITGLWRTDATSQMKPLFFNFLPEGSVVLLSYSPNALPQDFETITSVRYDLDDPSNPKVIEFATTRGNDVFVQGLTLLNILEYSEDSFTTRNGSSGEQTHWAREMTHRYFLTFAARGGPSQPGGPAFAMWTTMDGRQSKFEGLGVQITTDGEGRPLPIFGAVPDELYEQTTEQNDEEKKRTQEETVIMRFELNGRGFERTYKVFEEWDKLVKNRALPVGDPYVNAIEFIGKAADSLEPCGENIKLQKLDRNATDQITARYKPPQRPLEYITLMRKKNDEIHVPDRLFPWGWRPMVQLQQ